VLLGAWPAAKGSESLRRRRSRRSAPDTYGRAPALTLGVIEARSPNRTVAIWAIVAGDQIRRVQRGARKFGAKIMIVLDIVHVLEYL
jgi:hypothetical protein